MEGVEQMMLERLIDLDRAITLGINSLNTPLTDQFWMFFTEKTIWFPAYLFIAVMLVYRLGWKRGLTVILSLIVTVVLCDQISHAIKNGIQRLRPVFDAWMLEGGLHYPEGRETSFYGFFSGHASNSFSFIACSLIGFRNDRNHRYNAYCTWGYIWATLVSVSRIMMGRHFFGDILVGAVFGLAMGAMIGYLTRFIIQKWIERRPISKAGIFGPQYAPEAATAQE